MNEYVIINKTAIQKRIEELEKELKYLNGADAYVNLGAINALKQLLSQSTPLIPEEECSKVTEQIAIEFAEWLIKELILSSHGKYLSHKPKELFQEFLKTKQ